MKSFRRGIHLKLNCRKIIIITIETDEWSDKSRRRGGTNKNPERVDDPRQSFFSSSFLPILSFAYFFPSTFFFFKLICPAILLSLSLYYFIGSIFLLRVGFCLKNLIGFVVNYIYLFQLFANEVESLENSFRRSCNGNNPFGARSIRNVDAGTRLFKLTIVNLHWQQTAVYC